MEVACVASYVYDMPTCDWNHRERRCTRERSRAERCRPERVGIGPEPRQAILYIRITYTYQTLSRACLVIPYLFSVTEVLGWLRVV